MAHGRKHYELSGMGDTTTTDLREEGRLQIANDQLLHSKEDQESWEAKFWRLTNSPRKIINSAGRRLSGLHLNITSEASEMTDSTTEYLGANAEPPQKATRIDAPLAVNDVEEAPTETFKERYKGKDVMPPTCDLAKDSLHKVVPPVAVIESTMGGQKAPEKMEHNPPP